MSRTSKSQHKRDGWDRECAAVKRLCRRLFRAKSRQALREGRFDLMPIRKGTEGWITW